MRWQDGSDELMSLRALNRVLVPLTVPVDAPPKLRDRRVSAATTQGASDSGRMPRNAAEMLTQWEESTGMPLSPRTAEDMYTGAAMLIAGRQSKAVGLEASRLALEHLVRCIALPCSVFDPWSSKREALPELRSMGHVVRSGTSSEVWDFKPWEPASYQGGGPLSRIDAIVMAPPNPVRDWALALAIRAVPLVCMFVSTAWVRDAPEHRKSWFSALAREGRVLFIKAGHFGKQPAKSAAWVVVTQSALVMRVAQREHNVYDPLWLAAM